MSFEGIFTALITPFDDERQLDLNAFKRILDHQVKGGVAGVVVCGTTGEAPALEMKEKHRLIQTAVEHLHGSGLKVLAGTGSNHTALTIQFSKWASDAGLDAVLVVTPYYSKPTQAGLRDHFLAVADEIECGLILYNVPGRTGVTLEPETVAHLAQHPKILGLKDATGCIPYLEEVQCLLRSAERQLTILSGDDPTLLAHLAVGGSGSVSVASNLIPREMRQLYEAVRNGDLLKARALNDRCYPLFRDLFVESNPGPVKWAMAQAGFCKPHLRPPLAGLTPANAARVSETWSALSGSA